MKAAPPEAVHRQLRLAGGLQWHVRACGAARPGVPTLVLLHPSPRSSAMYGPWLPALAAAGRVIAVDTPGYGGSDPLPARADGRPPAMADYAAPLAALLQQVAGAPCVVYGSATGAQLALRLALDHPATVAHAVLDNAAHFDDAERDALLARYFPDLTPHEDGHHLAQAWTLCARMTEFFPWFADDEAHRIAPGPAPAAAVHAALAELLAAGPGWDLAYRAAFAHEHARHVQALAVPATVLRWAGSVLLRHIDALLAHPLPSNVRVVEVPAPQTERLAAMTALLAALRSPA